MKPSLRLLLEKKSLENVCRAKIVYIVLLPMGHPALAYLKGHIKSINNFRSQGGTIETMDLAKQPAKGIYHLQCLLLHLTKYWRDPSMSDMDK